MAWTIHRDLRGGGWSPESPNSAPVRLPENGPTGEPWWRFVLNDGDSGAAGSLPSERRDCTMGSTTYGRIYNLRGFLRFPEGVPPIAHDRWTLAGWELHGPNVSALRQALVMTELDAQRRLRLNANAGRDAPGYDLITEGPVEAGRVYPLELEFIETASDSEGYVRYWLDGVQVAERRGRTILQAGLGRAYFKDALYRYALNNGRLTKDWSGVVIRVGDPAEDDRADLTAFPGGLEPQEPGDTTAPRVTLSISNECVARLDLPDADTARVLVGVAGDPFPPIELTRDQIEPVTIVQLPRETMTPGVLRWGWTFGWDEAGNRSPEQPGVPFTPVASEEPPPPPPPPPGDCDEVIAERDAIAERMATLRSGIAAETQRHGLNVAGLLEASEG